MCKSAREKRETHKKEWVPVTVTSSTPPCRDADQTQKNSFQMIFLCVRSITLSLHPRTHGALWLDLGSIHRHAFIRKSVLPAVRPEHPPRHVERKKHAKAYEPAICDHGDVFTPHEKHLTSTLPFLLVPCRPPASWWW